MKVFNTDGELLVARDIGVVSVQADQAGGTSDTYGVLSGSINGSNTTFTVSLSAYVSGSLMVYLNGQLQTQGTGEDWTETSPGGGTFGFNVAPISGDEITVYYQYATTGSTGDADTLDGSHLSSLTLNTSPDVSGNSWVLDEDAMGSDDNTKVPTQQSVKAYVDSASTAYWTLVGGTPTRVSDTQFTVTDTGNANNYDSLYSKGTVLKWTNSGTKQAMVISATYSANDVTVSIIGDVFAAGFSDVRWGKEKARVVDFVVAGTIGAVIADVAGHWYAPMSVKPFGADIRLGTAGSGTTTIDINDDTTTFFTTKPSITTTNTADLDNTVDTDTVIAEDSKITVDIDAVAGTAGVDLYVRLYWTPNLNQYIT